MLYKISGIGRSRERPTVFIILSSLYSVQLYLVWYKHYIKMHSLTRAILQMQKCERKITHMIQVLCNFHFLLFFDSLFLSFSLFLFSMRYFFFLTFTYYFYSLIHTFQNARTHAHTFPLSRTHTRTLIHLEYVWKYHPNSPRYHFIFV